MPTSPTGGLSIFINITILIVGYIVKLVKKSGYKIIFFSFIYTLITDKKHDNSFRKTIGYGTAMSLFLVVFVSTSFSIYNRLTNESNYDIFAPKVTQVINNIAQIINVVKPEVKEDIIPIVDHIFNTELIALLVK